jgi:transposase
LRDDQEKELQAIISDKERSNKEIRRAMVVLMMNDKISLETIKKLTNYSHRQIFEIRKNYFEKGFLGIKDKREKGPNALLTKGQRKEILQVITYETPQDYGYDSPGWTTTILADLIELTYNVRYKSKTSYYILFHESKFTYHKPGRVYHKKNEEEVKKWKEEILPVIKKAFQDKDTIILTEDEMILSTQTTFQKIWLKSGDYPKIMVSNTRANRSVYGFLNIKTGKQHAFKSEKQNMYITRDMLKKIRKIYPKLKILLLWDNAGWHRGSKVQEFIKEDGNIETQYFPKYSPEENPQEHVWKAGRNHVTHNKFIKNIDKATDNFIEYLNENKFCYSLLGFSANLKC